MNTRPCIKIISRMNVLLLRELGEGVDPVRMLSDPAYARDVLLVCEAMRGTELAELAPRFKRAHAAALGEVTQTAGNTGVIRPGFSASRFLNSLFGTASTLDATQRSAADRPAGAGRSWLARARSGGKSG